MTDLQDLPPSAKCVLLALEYADAELTLDEIIEETRLSKSTALAGIRHLRHRDLVKRRVDIPSDARRHRYELTTLPDA